MVIISKWCLNLKKMIRYVLLVPFTFYLISCSVKDELRWMEKESQRRGKVQALIRALPDESLEERNSSYLKLRDTFVRKRDIPELKKVIAGTDSPNLKRTLQELITYINTRWRLPSKGWSSDKVECLLSYTEELDSLGYVSDLSFFDEHLKEKITHLDITDFSEETSTEKIEGAADLILILEPDSLMLFGNSWNNVDFLKIHPILEKLELSFTTINDLKPLSGMPNLNQLDLLLGEETAHLPDMNGLSLEQLNVRHGELEDLKSLEGLVGLRKLYLRDTTISDLSPLAGLSSLRFILLDNITVSDLTPLGDLQNLDTLYILNTKVTDLTPLKKLSNLRFLEIKNTPVSDLTPLKELENLEALYIKNTNVTDSSPLKQLPNLKESYIDLN